MMLAQTVSKMHLGDRQREGRKESLCTDSMIVSKIHWGQAEGGDGICVLSVS